MKEYELIEIGHVMLKITYDGINGAPIECSADDIDGDLEDGMIRMYNCQGDMEYYFQKQLFEESIHLDEYEDLLLALTKERDSWYEKE